MIRRISMPKVGGRRVVKVDGKEATLAGSSTWFTLQTRGSESILKRHIDMMVSEGLNFTRVWFWDTLGTKVTPVDGVNYMVKPEYGRAAFYRRMRSVVEAYLKAGIVPMVILFRARQGAIERKDWTFTEKDRKHIRRVLGTLEDLPYILDLMNEAPREARDFLRAAVRLIREEGRAGLPLNVNTGYGTGGMSENELITFCRRNGVQSYSCLDGSASFPPELVVIADTDHSRLVLQTRDPKAKNGWFEAMKRRGATGFLNMEAFEESTFHPRRNSSDPENPTIKPAHKWLAQQADPKPAETPMPDKPIPDEPTGPPDVEPNPIPDDPPGPPDAEPPTGNRMEDLEKIIAILSALDLDAIERIVELAERVYALYEKMRS